MAHRAARDEATTWQQERARIAGMSSRPNRPPDDPDLVEARRNFRALKLEDDVRKVLAPVSLHSVPSSGTTSPTF